MQQYSIGPDRRFVKYGPFDSLLLVLYVLLLLSLGVFGIGLKHYLWQQSFLSQAITTTGTITRVEENGGDRGSLYRPTVQFTPKESATPITFTSRMSSSKYVGVGETVTVYYQPNAPARAEVESALRSQIFGFAFMGAGGLFTLLFLAGIRKSLVGYEEPIPPTGELS